MEPRARQKGRFLVSNEQKLWYLFWAYNLIWIAMGGYLLWLGARERHLSRLIERLLRKLPGADRE
jgi:CcmD family protein